jgi:uncharacterized protein YndB with AHSA1/START domain
MPAKTGTQAISDAAVTAKTGKSWAGWFAVLDAFDVATHGHAATARHLVEAHGVSGWWAQGITVRYEQEKGLREVGQQSDRLYAVSVQRTVAASPERVWKALVADGTPKAGDPLQAPQGSRGTYLAVVPGAKLRHTVEHGEGQKPSHVEWTLTPKGDATVVRLQHSRLASKEEADALKPVWTRAVEALRDGFE